MIDSQTQALLQDALRRESSAFLLYVGDAFPWTTSRGVLALEQLNHLIAAERDAVAALARFLLRHKVALPLLGLYPSNFTSFNFLTLQHLVPLLIDSHARLLAQLEGDLPLVTDPEAKAQLTKLTELKRQHLDELKTLLPAPQAASA